MTKEDPFDEHATMSPADGPKRHPSHLLRFHADGAA